MFVLVYVSASTATALFLYLVWMVVFPFTDVFHQCIWPVHDSVFRHNVRCSILHSSIWSFKV